MMEIYTGRQLFVQPKLPPVRWWREGQRREKLGAGSVRSFRERDEIPAYGIPSGYAHVGLQKG